MYVHNPIKTEGVRGHISYCLAGLALSEDLQRRFSDFYTLREKLLERWPGMYIPGIPPKKTIGNSDQKLINGRVRLLNEFCLKLSKFDFLFNSDEVKIFQRNVAEPSKTLNSLPKLQYTDILMRFKDAIQGFQENYDLIIGKAKLQEFGLFLKNMLKQIQKLQDSIEKIKDKNQGYIDKYVELLGQFEEHEKTAIAEFADHNENKLLFSNSSNAQVSEKIKKVKENLTNPYILLNEWIEKEEIDIQAMIDAMNGIEHLNQSFNKLGQKIDSLEAELKKAQSGKKGFLAGIIKNKENKVNELNNEKQTNEEQLEALHQIVRIVHFNMEKISSKFKEEKINEYYNILNNFAIMQYDNNILISELWEQIKNDIQKAKSMLGKN